MSVRHPLGIYAAYQRMIDETIAEAESLQSSAVLDQLRQRWTEKLQERLRQASSTSTASSQAPAFAEATRTHASAKRAQPLNHNQAPPAPSHRAEAGTPDPDISSERTDRTPKSSAAAFPSVPSTLTSGASSNRSAPASDLSRPEDDAPPVPSDSSPATAAAAAEAAAAQGNDDDDGWDATEWEAVPSTPSASETKAEQPLDDTPSPPTATVNITQQPSSTTASASAPRHYQSSFHAPNPTPSHAPQDSKAGSAESVTTALRPSTTQPRLTLPERRGAGGRGVIVESQSELYDDDEDINTDDLSDLEDDDPECSDLIVSQFEHVQRPHARKAAFKGLWRIKLRHGIVQIGGHELLFHTLAGDLSF